MEGLVLLHDLNSRSQNGVVTDKEVTMKTRGFALFLLPALVLWHQVWALNANTIPSFPVALAAATPVSPGTLVVDDDGQATPTNCNATTTTPYTTIQSAITAAAPGDTILVCPGTYQEELLINKSLILRGIGSPRPVIEAPNTLTDRVPGPAREIRAIIFVDGSGGGVNVEIDRFLIDGRGVGNGNNGFTGVTYFGASGTIRNCEIKAVRNTPFDGTQHGLPIVVTHDWDVLTPHDVTIQNNLIYDYQKGGIVCNELGAVCHILGNTVIGFGPTPLNGQNGIQVGFGARGEVIGNTVTDNFYTGPTWDAAGILLVGSGHDPFGNTVLGPTTVKNNTVDENEVGISIADFYGYFAKSVTVERNEIGGATGNDVGIRIAANNVAGNVARLNDIEGSATFGIDNQDPDEVFDASNNWWGDATGPQHTTNPGGGGDPVSDNVDFIPWLGIRVSTNAQFFGDVTRTVGVDLATGDFGVVIVESPALICSGRGTVFRALGGFSFSGRCQEDPRDLVKIRVLRGNALTVWVDRVGSRSLIRRFTLPLIS